MQQAAAVGFHLYVLLAHLTKIDAVARTEKERTRIHRRRAEWLLLTRRGALLYNSGVSDHYDRNRRRTCVR